MIVYPVLYVGDMDDFVIKVFTDEAKADDYAFELARHYAPDPRRYGYKGPGNGWTYDDEMSEKDWDEHHPDVVDFSNDRGGVGTYQHIRVMQLQLS